MSDENEIPFVAFSNEELASFDSLPDCIDCDVCGRTHHIETVESLSFYTCEEQTFLCGIDGKLLPKHGVA